MRGCRDGDGDGYVGRIDGDGDRDGYGDGYRDMKMHRDGIG